MNTTFRILWFEDVLTWYRMEKRRVEEILQEHYLDPEITCKDGSDFDITELKGNEYDLILMDYKLAQGTTGDTIGTLIRENDILTDILFYSSEEEDMLKAIKDNMPQIDGIYLTKRDNDVFTAKVAKLIRKIVMRSEDVVNLRGFVMDSASDFEVRIKEILNICWSKFSEKNKEELQKTLNFILNGKVSRAKANVCNAEKQEDVFAYSNNDDRLLSMKDRLDIMQQVLNVLFSEYGFLDEKCFKQFQKYYMDSIGRYRNKLGHVRFGEKYVVIDGKQIEINQELHRHLRKNIVEMDKAIEQIEKHVAERI